MQISNDTRISCDMRVDTVLSRDTGANTVRCGLCWYKITVKRVLWINSQPRVPADRRTNVQMSDRQGKLPNEWMQERETSLTFLSMPQKKSVFHMVYKPSWSNIYALYLFYGDCIIIDLCAWRLCFSSMVRITASLHKYHDLYDEQISTTRSTVYSNDRFLLSFHGQIKVD